MGLDVAAEFFTYGIQVIPQIAPLSRMSTARRVCKRGAPINLSLLRLACPARYDAVTEEGTLNDKMKTFLVPMRTVGEGVQLSVSPCLNSPA